MKKLLALGIALVMVMTMTAAVFAAVTIVGDYTLTYDFNAQKDKNEVNLDFSGKNNDVVSWLVRTKFTDAKTFTVPTGITVIINSLWMNEAYFTIKQSYGSFQLGMWEIKSYNTSILDNGEATFGKLKSMLSVGYTAPQFFAGFIGKVVYMRDNNAASDNDGKIANADGAYMITLGYAAPSKKWGFDYNIVDTNMNSTDGVSAPPVHWTPVPTQEAGYALNAFVYPLDNLRLYVHAGHNNESGVGFDRMIGGAYLSFGKWFTQAEYNFEEIAPAFNMYGYKLGYNFSNSVSAEWRHSDKASAATNMGAQELRIFLKFK
jgi:hypothetical protein